MRSYLTASLQETIKDTRDDSGNSNNVLADPSPTENEEEDEVEINEGAVEESFIEVLKFMKRTRQQYELGQDQLEDVEGSQLKKIKDTDFYYDTETKLIVDKDEQQPLKDMDDVKLFTVINRTRGSLKLISISP